MASSLKLSELPSSSNLNSSDLLLVADIENQSSKTVRFDSLNSALSFDQLIGYDTYVSELSDVNSTLTQIIGTFSDATFRSLGDLYDIITANADLETTRHDSLTNTVDALDTRVSTDLITNASNIANLVTLLEEIEDRRFQEGLATGYLYVTNCKVGEN